MNDNEDEDGFFFNKTKQNSTNRENGLAAYLSVYLGELCEECFVVFSTSLPFIVCPFLRLCLLDTLLYVDLHIGIFFQILPCCSIAQLHRTVRKSGYANLSIPFSLACLSVRGLPPARLIKYCGHPGGSLLPAAEKRSSPSSLLFLEQDVCYIIGWRAYAFLLLRTKQQTTTRIMKTPELTI